MSFSKYGQYKESGVRWLGSVPAHWPVTALKHVFTVVGGSTPKSEVGDYWDSEHVWVTPGDLSSLSGFEITESSRRITTAGLASCGTNLVPAGSIVLSTRAPIGSLAIAGTDLCTNQGCKSLLRKGRAQPRFYTYLLSIVGEELQTFPFALEEVRRLAATQGKRFAVIADEAHSSQTNETAAKLKLVLSAAELAELQDGGDVSAEDILAAQMSAKAGGDEQAGITYVAFTATPKDKTLQLFGTRPDPTRPTAADNLPAPFHVYSMRQAVEEGFILDVLKTYTSYKVAFSLAHHSKEGVKVIDSKEVDRSEAMKGIMGWVRLHEYNIAQRVQVVVE
ncbi:MAG: restriction endonuclease subunit S, partial [Rubrivivax sp.]